MELDMSTIAPQRPVRQRQPSDDPDGYLASLRREGGFAHALLRGYVEKPCEMFLWGQSHGILSHALLPWWYGDGRKLIFIETLQQRPQCFVIRGNSSWHNANCYPYVADVVGEISWGLVGALEDAFGRFDREEEEYDAEQEGIAPREWATWPEVDSSVGFCWGSFVWPKGLRSEGYDERSLLSERAAQ